MPIDRALFAQECVRQGVYFNVAPHYIIGVAELRSGISDNSEDDGIGPFRLTQAQWDANRDDTEFDLHFTPQQINSPTRQCAVFGLMAQRAYDAFFAGAHRAPSARELYLQQWPGADPAGLQVALDTTADLLAPAAEAVLDDPASVEPIARDTEDVSGPAPQVEPDPVEPVPEAAAAPGSMLTVAMLTDRWSRAKKAFVAALAPTAPVLASLGINTPLRMAHFMAQVSAECGEGTQLVESLKYTAANMMKVFPKRFPDVASTRGFVGNERAFGDKVYNGRMGNRPGSDDGFTFRGRGGLQLTGRNNYDAIGRSCGLDLIDKPDLAFAPENFFRVAGTEFVKLGCLQECDRDDVVQVSARINLGHPTSSPDKIVGLAERRTQLGRWKQQFGVA